MSIKATPAGVARTGLMPEGRFYRWRGQPWPAVPDGPAPRKSLHPSHEALRARQAAEAKERLAVFCGYRDEG